MSIASNLFIDELQRCAEKQVASMHQYLDSRVLIEQSVNTTAQAREWTLQTIDALNKIEFHGRVEVSRKENGDVVIDLHGHKSVQIVYDVDHFYMPPGFVSIAIGEDPRDFVAKVAAALH